ncbi:DUF6525 family protein [Acidimangrovimonas pyrenivorans]|uniref:DUF6525 family protein n=1 Tax=Acidimangrovimonas pyrenivorans TaxID=2030798 RepID=A0ABV7AI67_9RHOB
MSGANLGATPVRKSKRHGNPMAAYDRLPPPLRAWLAQAVLPWSARSASRAWASALRRADGDPDRARVLLTEAETRQLARARAPRLGAKPRAR